MCLLLFRNRFAIAVASLVWLIWRSGTQPRRLTYPCQQAASANLGALAVLIVPALARHGHQPSRLRRAFHLATGSVMLGGVLFVLINAGVVVYSNVADTYSPGNPAVVPWTGFNPSTPDPMSSRVLTPSSEEAVVAVNRNPNVTYGSEPYGPGTNTAYDLVWRTIADLHLGPADNPLADLVSDVDGDGTVEVLIKPNTVEYFDDQIGQRCPVYGHPAMLRPLVDMAAKAGARKILVGDGSDASGNLFTSRWDKMGYTQEYFSAMAAPWQAQGVTVQRVDFANRNKWSWVNLGAETGASAYVGSGYSSSHLSKSGGSSQYFNTADPHGRPGPGIANCKGWLAISDYVLDADVVIDLAKLKVHYLGINTAVLKNWVGITMYSTFNTTAQGASRVAHFRAGANGYSSGFGNDILWREMVDAHRAVLYWRNGTVSTTPQRRYLCVMDAINGGERYHVPGVAQPYWLKTVMASVDPVSIDAVGSRLQRYDFKQIPIVNNAHAASIGSSWPLGTADPARVRVVGGTPIDSSFNHLFAFELSYDSGQTWVDWSRLTVNDLTPPSVNAAFVSDLGGGQYRVNANIAGGHVAYFYYGDDGTGSPKVVRLARNGEDYTATITVTGLLGNFYVVAQDASFNTATFIPTTDAPLIGMSSRAVEHHVHIGESAPDGSFEVCNMGGATLTYSVSEGCEWLQAVAADSQSTGECDRVDLHYNPTGLYAGTYTCPVTVSGNGVNGPQTVTVTLVVETVRPDFDGDGDVDMDDFGHMQVCLSGQSGISDDPNCVDAKFDDDADIDSWELFIFRRCLTGQGVFAVKTCDHP